MTKYKTPPREGYISREEAARILGYACASGNTDRQIERNGVYPIVEHDCSGGVLRKWYEKRLIEAMAARKKEAGAQVTFDALTRIDPCETKTIKAEISREDIERFYQLFEDGSNDHELRHQNHEKCCLEMARDIKDLKAAVRAIGSWLDDAPDVEGWL